jgi:hypothetical protein
MNEISEKEWRKVRKKIHGKKKNHHEAGPPGPSGPPERKPEHLMRLSIEIRHWDFDYIGLENNSLFIRAKGESDQRARNYDWEKIPDLLTAHQLRRLIRHVEDLLPYVDPTKKKFIRDGVKSWKTLHEHTLHLG